MTTTADIIDNNIQTKHNFSGSDDLSYVNNIVREKLRIWNKLTRISVGGTDVMVKFPFNTFIEPFYSDIDVDTTVYQSAEYDEPNSRFKLFVDANGNRKYLESKIISFQNHRALKSVNITVYSEDDNGDDAIDLIDIYVNVGDEWIAVNNGSTLRLEDYHSADLDADLDASVGGQFSTWFGGDDLNEDLDLELSGALFDNKLKYKVIRNTPNTVYVNTVIIEVTYHN